MRRTATTIAMASVIVVMTAACSASTPSQPGEEITDRPSPTREETRPTEGEINGNGTQETSVELPGLPVGGSEIEFREPSTQCADVGLSGDPLPQGVRIRITSFDVPRQFSVSSEQCGSAPPCLSTELTAERRCGLAITWHGEPLAEGQSASLDVRSAVARCDEPAACGQAFAIVSGAAPGSIGILLPEPTTEETTETTDEPSNGTSESTDEPTDTSNGSSSSQSP